MNTMDIDDVLLAFFDISLPCMMLFVAVIFALSPNVSLVMTVAQSGMGLLCLYWAIGDLLNTLRINAGERKQPASQPQD